LFQAVQEFGEAVKPTFGGSADKKKRDKAASYVRRKGELSGIIKLVTGWHGIGHTVGCNFCA
jgi:hypothetical protein